MQQPKLICLQPALQPASTIPHNNQNPHTPRIKSNIITLIPTSPCLINLKHKLGFIWDRKIGTPNYTHECVLDITNYVFKSFCPSIIEYSTCFLNSLSIF